MPEEIPRCAYCNRPGTTKEHVPPDCFFPAGSPQLITVPACIDCNQNKSPDDEYVRNILAAGESIDGRSDLDEIVQKTVRSLTREKAGPKIRELKSTQFSEPVYDGGDDRIGFEADAERIRCWAEKLFDGLFYDANQLPISLDRKHSIYWLNMEIDQENWPFLRNLAVGIRDSGRLVRESAKGNFMHWALREQNFYASLCSVYNSYCFLCITQNAFPDSLMTSAIMVPEFPA